ncbi:hypothetical protein GCM10007423_39710 [Dyadobacter endophyticus]|uniref:Uncharacterized protein n=1 Tax=Dyadobacter endophyticus TaxID=1749036 RepID=A0ABQ1YXW2_9BACT|nr:hypothetical protein [Dyadobacter endophyticus]GGH42809.1 hypothetical protein GCM10007423_39710 [Dyadobacter endophyticus]
MLYLPKGMTVGCHNVQVRVLGPHMSPFDEKVGDGRFKLGVEYCSREDVFIERMEVRERIINIFKEMSIPLDISILDRFLFHQIRNAPLYKLMLPHGSYVITKIIFKEGMQWVYCEEMYNDPPSQIYFWQGPFSGICEIVHNNIQPKGIR